MKTASLHNEMVQWRHDLHKHPELGFEETRTASFVADTLESAGLEVHRGIGGTGVVGVLRRGKGGRSIGLRADMDALPISEINDIDYASVNEGVMHACGHDGHTTMLLGAARYLSSQSDFDGTVVFIFQPNEEHGLGAPAMIRDGLFERFSIDEVYAMHNMPGMPVGSFASRAGSMTASESLFEINILAAGGHAALPHMGVDAIVVGAQIVGALQTIVSRKLNPGLNGVVSVTGFETDGKRNVLPGTARLSGDARALSDESNRTIEARMREIVAGVCAAHGVTAEVSYDTIFPAIVNSAAQVGAAASAAERLFDQENCNASCEPKLFSEDFAHMASKRPGCFMLLGNGCDHSNGKPLHSADYDFNDDLLVPGSSFWVELVEGAFS